MTTAEDIQIQQLSHGIRPDVQAEGWHMCYYSEMAGNSRNEEYYFPCANDKECCGRECCNPIPGGFPLWLLILLVVLGFLLLLILILCIVYYCWKYCCKKKRAPTPPPKKPIVYKATPPPPPKVEMYTRMPLISGGTLRRIPSDNLIEMKPGINSHNNNSVGYNHHSSTLNTPMNSSGYSYNYGPATATRPKNFYSTTTTSSTIGGGVGGGGVGVGGVSPRQGRVRRVNNAYNRNHLHSTATDSSPGDELGTDRDRASDRDDIPIHDPHSLHRSHPGARISGSERYSLTMTTPTSNTASEREPMFVPSPMEETFVSAPRPIPVEHHDEREFTQEKRPLLSHVDTPREQKARVDYLRPFIPDPMEETVMPPPSREQIEFHHSSEISKERYAEHSVVEPPQGKRAQVIYVIPGEDNVAAY